MGNSGFSIRNRKLGPDEPVYIVAELSANHGQDYEQAVAMVEAAAEAGADAVKLQTYTPDTMTLDSDREPFRLDSGTAWDGRTLYDLYDEAYTPWDWHEDLKQITLDHGLDFFSTAYEETSVEFLENLGVPVHKLGSFELVHIPLIRQIAKTGKPLILSTGTASLGEIEDAVLEAKDAGVESLLLLHCISSYPAEPEDMNLRALNTLRNTFNIEVGLSDHSRALEVPVVAATLGACMIEKHLTLSREMDTPDRHFSLEPDEFSDMVRHVRTAEETLGSGEIASGEGEELLGLRRSIFVVKQVKKGDKFTEDNIACIRPSHGLAPKHFSDVINKKALQDISSGTPLRWELVG